MEGGTGSFTLNPKGTGLENATWAYSVDGGKTWHDVTPGSPTKLLSDTHYIIVCAVLNPGATVSGFGITADVEQSGDEDYFFTGKERDATGLYYFGARYYDPDVGRFITEDPAQDGENWYGYCDGDPVNTIDPDGKRTCFINGIRNPEASGPPDYANDFQRELIERGIKDVRLIGTFNNERGLGGALEGAYKVFKEDMWIDVYSNQIVAQIIADLKNKPLQKGEQLNIIGYSGGGQVGFAVSEKLRGKVLVNNFIGIGSADSAMCSSNIDHWYEICAAYDLIRPLGWIGEGGFFAGWYGHTDYFNKDNIDYVADLVNLLID